MLACFITVYSWAVALAHRVTARLTSVRLRDDRGQTSAEYALVLFGAASVALLVAMWAKNTDQVGKLLDAVFGNLVKMVR